MANQNSLSQTSQDLLPSVDLPPSYEECILGRSINPLVELVETEFESGMNLNWEPKIPEMSVYKRRLLTFNTWPKERPTPYALALSGFYYLGSNDRTRCFFCGRVLRDWEFTDNAFLEHKRWSESCRYLNSVF